MLDGAIPVDRAVMAKMDINRLIKGSAPDLNPPRKNPLTANALQRR